MLTRMKKIFLLVMFAAFTLVLVGCGATSEIKTALDNFKVDGEAYGEFQLPTADAELLESLTEWKSNNDAIKVNGTKAEVKRHDTMDVEVTLTATVTYKEKSVSKEFKVVVKKLDAPDEITVKPLVENGKLIALEGKDNEYVMLKGYVGTIRVMVPDDQMTAAVEYELTDENVVTINGDKIEAKELGITTIKAKSVVSDAKSEFTITVVEGFEYKRTLLKVKEEIINKMPETIYEDVKFPVSDNKAVKVKYFDAVGKEIFNGEYVYSCDRDHVESVTVVLELAGESINFDTNIRVVTSKDKNEFMAIDYAKAELDKIFKDYLGENGKAIDKDVKVLKELSAEVAKYGVSFTYDIENTNPSNPIKLEKGETEWTLKYNKPHFDSQVRLAIDIHTENVGELVRYKVVAKGYTKDEIIAYAKSKVLPQPNADGKFITVGANVTLPTKDTTGEFTEMNIAWKSSNEGALSNTGKFGNVEAETKVTMTATITYKDAKKEFKEEVAFEYTVKPSDDKSKKVSLKLGKLFEQPEFVAAHGWFPFGDLTRNADKALVNVMNLPKKISEVTTTDLTEYQDVAIKWTAAEEGLIDADLKLLKQYLRYHSVAFTFEIEIDGKKATNEFFINVGIAKDPNTIYVGGNLGNQQETGDIAGDVLCQLSKFDKPVGNVKSAAKTWGFGKAWDGSFGGYTITVEVTDAETNETRVHQYYSTYNNIMILDDTFAINGTEVTVNAASKSQGYKTNWGLFFINTTNKDQKIPFSPIAGAFLGEEGEDAQKWAANANFGRDQAFSFDGYRSGFVADKDGNVIVGNGEGQLQLTYDAGDDGILDDDDYWVTIPAGGIGISFKTQVNKPSSVGVFCEKGAKLSISYYEPFGYAEGYDNADLGTFKHE